MLSQVLLLLSFTTGRGRAYHLLCQLDPFECLTTIYHCHTPTHSH